MKCINCGKEIPENSKFCMECGTSVVQKEITCKKSLKGKKGIDLDRFRKKKSKLFL